MNKRKLELSLWNGQFFHCLSLGVLLSLAGCAWSFGGGELPVPFWLAILLPVVHQVFVWLSWRIELTSSATSKYLGFKLYTAIFFVLFGGRFISLLFLAVLDSGSLGVDSYILIVLTSVCLSLGGYAMYSVMKYFGMERAAGADHFDLSYRTMPFVKKGIFRFTNNGMYTYAFLLFWAIALGFNSRLALIVAAFSHVYIWVHFYCTEKPDIDYIYNSSPK